MNELIYFELDRNERRCIVSKVKHDDYYYHDDFIVDVDVEKFHTIWGMIWAECPSCSINSVGSIQPIGKDLIDLSSSSLIIILILIIISWV